MPRPKIGIIPGSTISSTGVKTITGLDFKPKLVKFTVLPPNNTAASTTATGAMDDGGTQFTTSTVTTASASVRASHQAGCIGIYSSSGGGSWFMFAKYTSMDDDGFSIEVTTAASSSNYDIAYEAY